MGQLYLDLAQLDEGPDDCVSLFGFSRGAFKVPALAGLLHRCQLPKPSVADAGDERFEQAFLVVRRRAGRACRSRPDRVVSW
jgi:uncharacterized protein (DUF2235 family)